MEDQFIPYELALQLKELGFNESCFGIFQDKIFLNYNQINISLLRQLNLIGDDCLAPIWQQAFDWFRHVHYLPSCLEPYISTKSDWEDELEYIPKIYTLNGKIQLECMVYEEARLACLEKLIELIKK